MKAMIPRDPNDLGGPSVVVGDDHFDVLATNGKTFLVEFREIPVELAWFEAFELMYCQAQHGTETIKVIRKATAEERRQFRIPLWIQGDDVPQCCGQPMFFVGQIDDDSICTERPPGARLWWHDAASFYVFTCSQCLRVTALGQQF